MSQGTSLRTAEDVVSFLKVQHEQIKVLFAQVEALHGAQREQAFFDLRRLLAVHETAEEEIVHPRARRELAVGESVVDARLQEEREAKQALSALEDMDVDTAEFEDALAQLREAVIAHAEAEEREEFSKLATVLGADELGRMRRAAEAAERLAPTHPHPGIESRSANLMAGPFAAMLDRAKDAITRPRSD